MNVTNVTASYKMIMKIKIETLKRKENKHFRV